MQAVSRRHAPALNALSLLSAALLFLLVPLVRGGNRHVALAVLEWIGLLLIVALAFQWLMRPHTSAIERMASGWQRLALLAVVGSPLWIAGFQLVPWTGGSAISTTPQATVSAAMVGLLCAGALMAGLCASPAQLHRLFLVWIAGAVVQAFVGLLQMGGVAALDFGMVSPERVRGTFASKNSFANFLVMVLPLICLSWFRSFGQGDEEERPAFGMWGWGLLLLLVIAALFASASRTGIATGALALVLSFGLLSRQSSIPSRWLSRKVGVGILGALLVAGLLMGGLDWVSRFDMQQLASDVSVRAINRDSAWQGAIANLPWGVGLGGFASAFPRYQAEELGFFLVDMAHNDYLQLLMEAGIPVLLVSLLVCALVGHQVRQLWRSHRQSGRAFWARERIQTLTACAIGLLAILLHAVVDYPFHIPANAVLASFLMGVFLRSLPPSGESRSSRKIGEIHSQGAMA